MQILEYDDVDPLGVLSLNRLALGFALTPERVAALRRDDPRPFPGLALYAEEDGLVVGQVGVFRLPMVSTEGREDVGGVWAVSTHPAYAGQGVAARLLEEAHDRMRAAGLRFSTLSTDRFRIAYRLYRRHGYEDMQVWASALAPRAVAHVPTGLRAEPAGAAGLAEVERLYHCIASGYLGFAWRHTPFARLREVDLGDVWLLSQQAELVGYALARVEGALLSVSNLLVQDSIDTAQAVAAVAGELEAAYLQVAISRPAEVASLRRAGYHVTQPDWGAFMLKPLVPQVNAEAARQLFGIGTDRFLISWLDVT
jgi:GNAT superfamily N-acetyltransferase